MRKFFLAAALAVASCTAPAHASEAVCQPLPQIGAELRELGITKDQVFATTDVSFISIYNASAGLTLPSDVAPIGMIIIATDKTAIVGLVERRDGIECVRYTQRLDVGVHKRAFAAAKVGA